METIIAGTILLATDTAAASLMGFETDEISTFTWAHKAGLRPPRLEEIETLANRSITSGASSSPVRFLEPRDDPLLR